MAVTRYVLLIVAVAMLLGLHFKLAHYPGASILLVVGLGGFAALQLVELALGLSKPLLSRKGEFVAHKVLLAVVGLVMLFGYLHLPGTKVLQLISTGLAVVLLVALFIRLGQEGEPDPERKANWRRMVLAPWAVLAVAGMVTGWLAFNRTLAYRNLPTIEKELNERQQMLEGAHEAPTDQTQP